MREDQRSAVLADLVGFQDDIAAIASSILSLQEKIENLMSKIISAEEKESVSQSGVEQFTRRSARRRQKKSRIFKAL